MIENLGTMIKQQIDSSRKNIESMNLSDENKKMFLSQLDSVEKCIADGDMEGILKRIEDFNKQMNDTNTQS